MMMTTHFKGAIMTVVKEKKFMQRVASFKNEFHKLKIKMSGENTHNHFKFFQISDFIKEAMELLEKNDLVFQISFDCDPVVGDMCRGVCYDALNFENNFSIYARTAEAEMPKATPVQQRGGEITYMRRYVWQLFLDLVDFDGVDPEPLGSGMPDPEPETPAKPAKQKKPKNTSTTPKIEPEEKPMSEKTVNYRKHFDKQMLNIPEDKLPMIKKIVNVNYDSGWDKLSVTDMKVILKELELEV